jgi:hypothetical protein
VGEVGIEAGAVQRRGVLRERGARPVRAEIGLAQQHFPRERHVGTYVVALLRVRIAGGEGDGGYGRAHEHEERDPSHESSVVMARAARIPRPSERLR